MEISSLPIARRKIDKELAILVKPRTLTELPRLRQSKTLMLLPHWKREKTEKPDASLA
jgi:hypothetical protein